VQRTEGNGESAARKRCGRVGDRKGAQEDDKGQSESEGEEEGEEKKSH